MISREHDANAITEIESHVFSIGTVQHPRLAHWKVVRISCGVEICQPVSQYLSHACSKLVVCMGLILANGPKLHGLKGEFQTSFPSGDPLVRNCGTSLRGLYTHGYKLRSGKKHRTLICRVDKRWNVCCNDNTLYNRLLVKATPGFPS